MANETNVTHWKTFAIDYWRFCKCASGNGLTTPHRLNVNCQMPTTNRCNCFMHFRTYTYEMRNGTHLFLITYPNIETNDLTPFAIRLKHALEINLNHFTIRMLSLYTQYLLMTQRKTTSICILYNIITPKHVRHLHARATPKINKFYITQRNICWCDDVGNEVLF